MNDHSNLSASLTNINCSSKLLSGLGKCTKRGLKKCFKCGKLNGTKSLICKNNQCGVVLRVSEEKCKVELNAVKLNTGTVRQVFSVQVRDVGRDHRGFVQLPLRNTHADDDNSLITEVALCFVDSCQRLFDDSILKCHEEESISNEGSSFCQHIKAALKSCNMAAAIDIQNDTLRSLKISDEIKMKLLLLATEKEGPLVQRVSKYVMAVKCQVTPKHPLGYLHFTFGSAKGKEMYEKYYCSCAEFLFSSSVRDKSNNIRYKCLHYYACIWALASNEKYSEEFGCFINYELPTIHKQTIVPIVNTVKEVVKEKMVGKARMSLKRKRKTKKSLNSIEKKKCKLLMPKIFPIQIKILNEVNENPNVTWEFMDWVSYVTESINKTMQFENCGLLNTQVFHIPEVFYKCFKSKIPTLYLENQVNGLANEEFFHIMNILHVKEIFDTPKRLFDDSILKCHEEESISNEGSSFCQHIKAALKSCNMAAAIDIQNDTLRSLKISDEIKMKLLLLATEKEGPLVQRVSKYVMAVKCQVTPKHPLGYLHFTFGSAKGKEMYEKYYCSCAEFLFSSSVRDKSNNIRYKCLHYYACIWALASNEKYSEEFGCFINYELPTIHKQTIVPIVNTVKEVVKEKMVGKARMSLKRKRKTKKSLNSIEKKKCKLLMPKIFPIQIKILNEVNENPNVTWEFMDWVSYVTESINKTMQFENCGLLNTQVFHIPEVFYKCFKSKIPTLYLENQVNGLANEEFFHIMNILHVKEIFDTPKIKLRLSKKFVHNECSGFVEDEKNDTPADNYQSSFIFFLNVGQSTIDESDNTNNSFFIEWLPNITTSTKVGQLKLQYKYGRKSTCILTTE